MGDIFISREKGIEVGGIGIIFCAANIKPQIYTFYFYFQNPLDLSQSYNPEKLVNASEGHQLHPSASRENILL